MRVDSKQPADVAAKLKWFHSIDLGNGLVTEGLKSLEILRNEADVAFSRGVAGKSVLDIGAWDGFFSFEAWRRGARRVLATDHYCWSGPGWGTKDGFNLAREVLSASSVEDMDIDLLDLSHQSVGRFEIVLFLGVFYHLKDPLGALERIVPLAEKLIVVETHIDALDQKRPAMVFYPGRELNNDTTNWWGPNPACISAMLRLCGCTRVEMVPHPTAPESRAFFFGHKS